MKVSVLVPKTKTKVAIIVAAVEAMLHDFVATLKSTVLDAEELEHFK